MTDKEFLKLLSRQGIKSSIEDGGAGKFHACARPHWCDSFRSVRKDRYVAIAVDASDLFEWTSSPSYPQKIGFRRGKVLYEVDRSGAQLVITDAGQE